MRVAIVGGTGMIGTWLADDLRARGDHVRILTRGRPKQEDHIQWDPARGVGALARLEGLDAIVNLNGAPIADRPWTKARRQVLEDSRIAATETLIDALGQLEQPPETYIGVGHLGLFYDQGETLIDDEARPGEGFLAKLSLAWEQTHLAAGQQLGCRSAVLRMSLVLSPTGGAFPLMVRPFRYGMGGWLGDGQQFTPWISIRDTSRAFQHLLDRPESTGCYNGTVPEPTRNKEWLKALGRVLNRPVLTHAPRWALRGALGELADDLFLASTRAVPRRLLEEGFEFVDGESEATFDWLVSQL